MDCATTTKMISCQEEYSEIREILVTIHSQFLSTTNRAAVNDQFRLCQTEMLFTDC